MIVHSKEYFHAMRKEMQGFLEHVNKQIYGNDALFLKKGIEDEIKLCDFALENDNCIHCFHRVGSVTPEGISMDGSKCSVNGDFPKDFNCGKYSCPNWVWEDVPY